MFTIFLIFKTKETIRRGRMILSTIGPCSDGWRCVKDAASTMGAKSYTYVKGVAGLMGAASCTYVKDVVGTISTKPCVVNGITFFKKNGSSEICVVNNFFKRSNQLFLF